LPSLDSALQPNSSTTSSKGLPRGSVTEVYGPPGVGKTTFAMQAAVNALHSPSTHHRVVWIDTGAPLPGPRFKQIFAAYKPLLIPALDTPPSLPVPEPSEKTLDNVSYFNVPTLAHLLTLFLHPTPEFPPPRTSLVVIDNISTVFATAFPRSADRRAADSTSTVAESARNAAQQKAAGRKWAVAGDLAVAMTKMASLHNLSILVINQVATSLKGVRKAVLKPSLSGNGWDVGVRNQVLLYRDFGPRDGTVELTVEERRAMRFAEVVKVSGKVATGTAADVVPFVIEDVSLWCLSKSPCGTDLSIARTERVTSDVLA
jgi:RecA/RadA recombinase